MMHIKHDNTHIVENIDSIDFKQLKIGDQVITFDKIDVGRYSENIINTTSHFIVSSFFNDSFISLDGVDLYIKSKNNNSNRNNIKYAVFNLAQQDKGFSVIIFEDNKTYKFEMSSSSLDNFKVSKIDLDLNIEEPYTKQFAFNLIYNEIFLKEGFSFELQKSIKIDKENYCIFIAFKNLKNPNSVLLFTIMHEFDFEKRSWGIDTAVHILDEDANLIKLNVNIEEFYDCIYNDYSQNSFTFYKDQFKKSLEIKDTEAGELFATRYTRNEKFWSFVTHFDFRNQEERLEFSDFLQNFFTPIWSNKYINFHLYSYIKDTKNYSERQTFLNYRDENLNSLEEIENKIKESNLSLREYDIIANIFNFFIISKQVGRDPLTGLLYNSYGNVIIDNNSYADFEGIIERMNNINSIAKLYIKVDNVFVMIDSTNEDRYKYEIKELYERENTLKVIESWE